MKTLKTVRRKLLADDEARAAYDSLADEFAIAHEFIAARLRAGLSQMQVAERMGTTQSVVARLEGGGHPPSMRTVQRFAQAVGGRVVLRIEDGAAKRTGTRRRAGGAARQAA